MRMRMTTCGDGVNLMQMGETFWAWDPGTFNDGIVEVDIEVPEGAYIKSEYGAIDDDGNRVNEYQITKPELVKIISERY